MSRALQLEGIEPSPCLYNHPNILLLFLQLVTAIPPTLENDAPPGIGMFRLVIDCSPEYLNLRRPI
jgi:hypothetical protein